MKSTTAFALLCAALAAWLVAPAVAQSAGQSAPAATFSARSEMVLVPAIVTDHNGAHVHGLTKDDFMVRENGVDQKVASFEEITTTSAPVRKVSTAGQRVYSNVQLADYAPRRINIVVLDLVNTGFLDQPYAKQQLIKYLSGSITSDELTSLMVLTGSGPRMIHDFTTDPKVLAAALKKVKSRTEMVAGESTDSPTRAAADHEQPAAGEATEMMRMLDAASARLAQRRQEDVVGTTLDAFEAIANAFRGVPGRKSLIWVSSAFPFRVPQPGDFAVKTVFFDRYESFFQKMNAANVAIYPVDARGLVVTSGTAADSTAATVSDREQQHTDTIQTILAFADMTGGRAFYNTNDLSSAMARAAEDSSSYYLLAYYASAKAMPGWRKIAVKVRQRGLEVRARSGYFAVRDVEPNPERRRKRDIAEALDTPFNFTGLPVSVRILGEQPAEESKRNVSFEISIEPNSLWIDPDGQNHMNFQVVAVAHDSAMQQAGGIDQQFDAHVKPELLQSTKSKPFLNRQEVKLPVGDYTLKVVVRDNLSGRVGSVSAALTVE